MIVDSKALIVVDSRTDVNFLLPTEFGRGVVIPIFGIPMRLLLEMALCNVVRFVMTTFIGILMLHQKELGDSAWCLRLIVWCRKYQRPNIEDHNIKRSQAAALLVMKTKAHLNLIWKIHITSTCITRYHRHMLLSVQISELTKYS